MRDWEKTGAIFGWLFVWFWIALAGGVWAWASYAECRRVHPAWYCVAN